MVNLSVLKEPPSSNALIVKLAAKNPGASLVSLNWELIVVLPLSSVLPLKIVCVSE